MIAGGDPQRPARGIEVRGHELRAKPDVVADRSPQGAIEIRPAQAQPGIMRDVSDAQAHQLLAADQLDGPLVPRQRERFDVGGEIGEIGAQRGHRIRPDVEAGAGSLEILLARAFETFDVDGSSVALQPLQEDAAGDACPHDHDARHQGSPKKDWPAT